MRIRCILGECCLSIGGIIAHGKVICKSYREAAGGRQSDTCPTNRVREGHDLSHPRFSFFASSLVEGLGPPILFSFIASGGKHILKFIDIVKPAMVRCF